MDLMNEFFEKAKANLKTIVYPAGDDERIVKTAAEAVKQGLARPIVLGNPEDIAKLAEEAGVSLEGVELINPKEDSRLEGYIEQYASARDVKPVIAKKLVKRPLFFGGMLVKNGDADGMVAGSQHATASVIQAASLTIGLKFSTPTSYFLMILPEFMEEKDKVFVFADSAVNINPTAQELGESAVAVARDARVLAGVDPKVALLSCSTKGSASHDDVDKVTQALEVAKGIDPELPIDGELQADAAIIPRVAAKKVKESDVAGQANVLIFPDLDSGNIAYKLVQYMGNAAAIGPVLVGFNKPVNDLSRGASVEDIVGVTAITAVQAG
jgi:phosphate acetyltransferase